MEIEKASGKKVTFDQEKIIISSKRAGASDDLAAKAARQASDSIKKGDSTEDVYKNVLACLQLNNPRVAAKYSLKRAIMRLGPAGYVFERYLGAILTEYGFKVATGIIVKGKCISHEVDVVAQKGDRHIIAEAKYHNRKGIRSGAKDALYTWARFQDIQKRMEEVEKPETNSHEGWLVTNTKVSSDVRKYAQCVGLRVVSWRYPKNGGLEKLIEDKGLYPVTIIPSLNHRELERLSFHKTIFALDLLTFSPEEISKISGMKKGKAQKVIDEIKSICF